MKERIESSSLNRKEEVDNKKNGREQSIEFKKPLLEIDIES